MRACACYTYIIIDIIIFLYNSNTYITIYLVIINNYLILKEFFFKVIFLRLFLPFFYHNFEYFCDTHHIFCNILQKSFAFMKFFTILKTQNKTANNVKGVLKHETG